MTAQTSAVAAVGDLRPVGDWDIVSATSAWSAARKAAAMGAEVVRLADRAGDRDLSAIAGVVAHVAAVAERTARARAHAAVREHSERVSPSETSQAASGSRR